LLFWRTGYRHQGKVVTFPYASAPFFERTMVSSDHKQYVRSS
jgi:hypothetical protein